MHVNSYQNRNCCVLSFGNQRVEQVMALAVLLNPQTAEEESLEGGGGGINQYVACQLEFSCQTVIVLALKLFSLSKKHHISVSGERKQCSRALGWFRPSSTVKSRNTRKYQPQRSSGEGVKVI